MLKKNVDYVRLIYPIRTKGNIMGKYCTNCGVEMVSGADGCIKCGKLAKNSSSTDNPNFCSNCGSEVTVGGDMCMKCGKLYKNQVTSSESKSKLVAGLLALFIGTIGIHNFYLGYNNKGYIHIALCVGGLLTFGITIWVSSIWALVEAIQIFTSKNLVDSKGVPLKD